MRDVRVFPLIPGLSVASLVTGHGLSGCSMCLGPGWWQCGTVVPRGTVNTGGWGQRVRYQGGQVGVTAVHVSRVTVAAVAGAGYLVSPATVHRLSLILHCHTSAP